MLAKVAALVVLSVLVPGIIFADDPPVPPAPPNPVAPAPDPETNDGMTEHERELKALEQKIKKAKIEAKHERALAKSEAKLAKLQRKTKGTGVDVIIDQKNNMQMRRSIRLRDGQDVVFRIIKTSRDCYEFNFAEFEEETEVQATDDGELEHNDNVEFHTVHDEATATYKITATRKQNRTEKECPYPGEWEIRVREMGWELSFAGSYVVHKLTDPSYALKPGTGADAGSNEITLEDKEDDWDQAAVAMVHLSHTDAFHLGKGVHWAPLSFGIDVASDGDANYYAGTGLRFGKKAFLTAGAAFGARDELGPGLALGDFITEPNLPIQERNDTQFFLGVSFSFADANISDKLAQPFAVQAPKPSDGGGPAKPESQPDTETPGTEGEVKEKVKGSATMEDLNLRLTSIGLKLTSIEKKPDTGEDLDEVIFEFTKDDGSPGEDGDAEKIVEKLGKKWDGTTFTHKPAP